MPIYEFKCRKCGNLLDMTSTAVTVVNTAEVVVLSVDCDNCDSYALVTYTTPYAQYFDGEGNEI